MLCLGRSRYILPSFEHGFICTLYSKILVLVLIFQFFFNKIEGKKELMPVMLPFGLMEIYPSGIFVVADLGLQVKYDSSHAAFILLLNATKV